MSAVGLSREILYYQTMEGRIPYREWFEGIKDQSHQQRIDARLARVEVGNLGIYRGVGEGVQELKFSDGTRIYLGEDGPTAVVLLLGGRKDFQIYDIKAAKAYWSDYKKRKRNATKTRP